MRLLLVLLAALQLSAQPKQAKRDYNAPFPPHKVIGNVYYVGTEQLATFLITTPQGHILINSDFEATVPAIRASVEKLGFKFTDIKIILGSHAHGDHMEGDALAKELSGARVMAMEQDVPWLRKMTPGNKPHPIDKVLKDGEQVSLLDLGTGVRQTVRTGGDAVWWAFCTVTTVGYGDYTPITVQGRVVAVLLMISGVVLVGLVVASFSSWARCLARWSRVAPYSCM